jgi:tRNA (adenine37-N6)-methyltransferase
LYIFSESSGFLLSVKPFLDDRLHGLFTTRHPCLPNPIGVSFVRLLKLQGNIMEIEGVDMLDGTPLLDIKPYVPEFDIRTDTHVGWYETRSRR